jgi:PAS domain S-box-containing protein
MPMASLSSLISKVTRRAHLQTLVIVSFVLLVVVSVGLTSYLSFRSGAKAVDYLAGQLMSKITSRIQDRLHGYLDMAHMVNEINANAFHTGQLDWNDSKAQELHFWHQIHTFGEISYNYMGHAQGGFYGARRLADGTLETIATNTLSGGDVTFFRVDDHGQRTEAKSVLESYDHKDRPWYKAAVKAGRSVWSDVFVDAGGEGLTITAAQPVYDKSNNFRGALGCSFIFSHINKFLQGLEIGQSGQTFIMDRSGMLVATSTADPVSTQDKNRIHAMESENPLIKGASTFLSERFGDYTGFDISRRLSVDLQGESSFLQLTPLRDGRGIDWLIVVVVPENDFMTQINANTRSAMALCLIALCTAMTAGFAISRWIVRPILHLNTAAECFAQGEWTQTIDIDRDDEVGELSKSFNIMAKQLREFFESLGQRVQDRTAEILEINHALRESEEKYRELVDFLPISVFQLDQRGNVTATNRCALELLGYSNDDVDNGLNAFEMLIPEDRDRADEYFLRVLNGEATRGNEYTCLRRDGGRVPAVVLANPIIRDGKIVGVRGAVMDISERKGAEAKLRDSEQQMHSIIQGYPIPAFVIGKDHRVIYWNKALEELSGIKAHEVVGTIEQWRAFYSAERPCMADLLIDETLGAIPHWYNGKCSKSKLIEEAYEATEFYPDLGDNGKWLHFTAAAIRNSQGVLVGAIETHDDVTRRKKTEEALITANQQLRDIIEFLPDATFVVDKDHKVIAWNRAIEEMTGISKAGMIGKADHACTVPFYGERRPHLLDLIDAEDEDLESKYQLVQRKGNILYAQTYVPHLYGGKGAYVFATGAPLFDMHGNRVGAIESIRDITESKLKEDALKESQQQLADIINFLPDATFVIDKDGKVIAWNRAIEEMTGIKAHDVLGKGDYEYTLPFYGERRPILIDLVLEPQGALEAKYDRVERKDAVLEGEAYMPELRGREVYLFGKASILRDSKGNIVGAIESIRDITERKRVEEALARAEEKYRGIFENAIMGIFQTAPEGQVISANPACARIFGYDSPEELLDAVTDISRQLYVNPERRTELLQVLEEQGVVREFETQLLRKDRDIAWVSLNIRAVLDNNGNVACWEGTIQNITDRKALESRLVQAHKMEAIGTLAGGIAHDFNNILSAVIGYTEMTKGKIDQPVLQGHLGQVLKACERARSLVGQILTFSRGTEQERRPVDLVSLIKEGLKLLRATLPSTITFQSKIDPGTHTVLADPTQIHQVLINLCTNAAHAMLERGGMLEISLDNVEIPHQVMIHDPDLSPGPYERLTVSDTGAGIAPEIMHRIFDPFFTTKRKGEGTGLGLSVVYGIVRSCGGTVTVQSNPGTGSIFSVYLPATPDYIESRLETPKSVPGGSERILFVDDEELILGLYQEMLEDLGYQVTATRDSMKAMEIFRGRPDQFDLVITDMTMPGMTGKDLSTKILKLRPDIPIILCTGFNELITEEKASAIGIREFAMKPLNQRTIAALIRKALETGGAKLASAEEDCLSKSANL